MDYDVGKNVDMKKTRGQEGNLSFGVGSRKII
jgi:hypothetical protein